MGFPLFSRQINISYLKRKRIKLPLLILFFNTLLAVLMREAGFLQAQPITSGISEPASDSVISGVVTVVGTAVSEDYLRYELAFRPEGGTDADWVVFAEGAQPVVNGTLAIWDTTVGREINAPVWPDGRYRLRLRVVRTDFNYSEYFVTNLTVANNATPTPTPVVTPTLTVAGAAPQPRATQPFLQLTPIPSLTPFPTLTPLPLPVADPIVETAEATAEPRGLLGQLSQVNTAQFGRAFWQGAVLAAYAFAALFVYLLLRAVLRFLWRRIWRRI